MASPNDVTRDLAADPSAQLPSKGVPPASTASTLHYENPTATGAEAGPAPKLDLPVFPDYDVLGVIGRGGMGIVMKARHRVLDRLVAIKMPLDQHLADGGDRDRFLREARSAARLRHPHICPIHEVGQLQDRPYLVMGFIQGETLRDWAKTRPPTPRAAAEMVAALARAVGYAHEHGVIHRDIKPSNVIVDADSGQPVLMDFGLAKELTEDAIHMTQTGQVMGTPAYMAPEQAAGQIHRIGPATDVYALGVVLYELLCARLPFLGNVGSVLVKVQSEEPPAPRQLAPRLHRDLETICLKAIAKDPGRRYGSAKDLADDLQRFNAGEAIEARREGLAARVWRGIRRRPTTVTSVLVGLAALSVGAYFAATALESRRRAGETEAARQLVASGLDAPELTEAYLEKMEARIGRMDDLGAEDAAAMRLRLHQVYGAALRDAFSFQKKPVLRDPDVTRLNSALKSLTRRDSLLADSIRRELADRLGSTQQVIDLKPPFTEAQAVFGAAARITDNSLRRASQPNVSADPHVLTIVPCQGNVEIRAVFDSSWAGAARIGMKLNAGAGKGYSFELSARPPDAEARGAKPFPSFTLARRQQATARLEILRNGVSLRQLGLPVAELFADSEKQAGALRLEANRHGNRLTLRVNGGRPLEFEDVFPLGRRRGGFFGLYWPEKVGLTRLQASCQAGGGQLSPLEKGDDFFADEQYDEALAEYRAQSASSRDRAVRLESRYKEGCCLAELGRGAEAEPIFKEVSVQTANVAQPGNADAALKHWSVRADAQLWLLYAREKRAADADRMLEKLSARQGLDFDSLANYVSEKDRLVVLGPANPGLDSRALLRKPEVLVRQLEQVARLRDVLDPVPRDYASTNGHFWAKVILMKGYRLAGRPDDARRVGDEVVRDYGYDANLIDTYCWLLRERGEMQRALAVARKGEHAIFILERCRIHVALKDWDQAERELKVFFDNDRKGASSYNFFAPACLMEGFLQERRGRPDAAREAWRRGCYSTWAAAQPRQGVDDPLNERSPSDSYATLLDWIMAALSDSLSDRDAQEKLVPLLRNVGGPLAGKMTQTVGITPAVCRAMWQSPRGRELARKIAFRDLSYAEYLRGPVFLLLVETAHQSAMPGPLSNDDEELLWQLVPDFYAAFIDGKIKYEDAFAIVFVWKDKLSWLGAGWADVLRKLPPRTGAQLAYVIGRRYQHMRKPQKSPEFFAWAVKHAPPNSTVQRLAQAELDKMKKK